MKNFALTGVAGYVAPRHLKAIKETGNNLVAVADPHDSVGILDNHFWNVSYFKEFERFDRFLEKNRRENSEQRIQYLSVCSPNYLHDSHIRLALRVGADAICEKPVVLNPWNLKALQELALETRKNIFTILQLRLHPSIVRLKEKYSQRRSNEPKPDIVLTYVTARGLWYLYSWKGDKEKSGGLSTNVGIHFFDMLTWIFGKPVKNELHYATPQKESGYLELEHAHVRWFLSIDGKDLPFPIQPGKKSTFRAILINGQEFEFSEGFADLHTASYRANLDGHGFSIEEARTSVEVCQEIRTSQPVQVKSNFHPSLESLLKRGNS